jgi:DNA-binding NtrC family response regulator
MDDEAGIRRAAGVALLRRGYEVTTVADGREAIEEFSLGCERRRPYSLVILDLTIPGEMGGKEAVVAIRQIDPGIRVIVSSGYSNDPAVAEYRAFGFDATLPKPYQVDQLVAVVDKTLARITPRNPETATQMGSNS